MDGLTPRCNRELQFFLYYGFFDGDYVAEYVDRLNQCLFRGARREGGSCCGVIRRWRWRLLDVRCR